MNTLTFIYVSMFFIGIFLLLLFVVLHYRHRDRLYYSPQSSQHPSISILVPAYNEEKHLENTVKALLNLKYPKGKKKIILINDGSTDGTRKLAKGLAAKHSEIQFLDKKNSGKANSLNEALKLVKSELMAVVD